MCVCPWLAWCLRSYNGLDGGLECSFGYGCGCFLRLRGIGASRRLSADMACLVQHKSFYGGSLTIIIIIIIIIIIVIIVSIAIICDHHHKEHSPPSATPARKGAGLVGELNRRNRFAVCWTGACGCLLESYSLPMRSSVLHLIGQGIWRRHQSPAI